MSKGQTLRALVNARLTAAAEEIFALFERTIAEFEEELRQEKDKQNQSKQELLDSLLSPRVVLLRADLRSPESPGPGLRPGPGLSQDLRSPESPGPGLSQDLNQGLNQRLSHGVDQRLIQGLNQDMNQDLSQAPWLKEEPEEQCIKPESLFVPEPGSFGGEGETSDVDNVEDWTSPFSCSGAQTETAAGGSSSAQNALHYEPEVRKTAPKSIRKKSHKCPFCMKTFGNKHNLKVHSRVHTGDRPFSCPVCGKMFGDRYKVKLHMRTHTGERPFCCSFCDKTYIQKAHLDAHTRKHTGHRPFSCSICGKSFTQSSHLKGHRLTHLKASAAQGVASGSSQNHIEDAFGAFAVHM